MKWNEVKWNEMKWSEMKWSEVKWNEMKWNEMTTFHMCGDLSSHMCHFISFYFISFHFISFHFTCVATCRHTCQVVRILCTHVWRHRESSVHMCDTTWHFKSCDDLIWSVTSCVHRWFSVLSHMCTEDLHDFHMRDVLIFTIFSWFPRFQCDFHDLHLILTIFTCVTSWFSRFSIDFHDFHLIFTIFTCVTIWFNRDKSSRHTCVTTLRILCTHVWQHRESSVHMCDDLIFTIFTCVTTWFHRVKIKYINSSHRGFSVLSHKCAGGSLCCRICVTTWFMYICTWVN